MHNNILFGMIGMLMLAIAGVGAFAVSKDITKTDTPAPVVSAPVVSTTVSTSGQTDERENENENEDDDDDEGLSGGTSAPVSNTPAPAPASAPTSGQASPTLGTFTLAQVAQHNSSASCWTAINGSVYDLTPFVGRHPGGSVILRLCGTDGTFAFMAQHGGKGKPEQELANLKIGLLAK